MQKSDFWLQDLTFSEIYSRLEVTNFARSRVKVR